MSKGNKILIVDDDVLFRDSLCDILTINGYIPIVVSTGRGAIKQLNAEFYGVALVDLELEDMTGLDLIRKIKERPTVIECILITGYASQKSAVDAVNIGAYGYVTKPYDIEQLILMIQRAIEKQESEEKYKAISNSANDAIIMSDGSSKILYWNKAAERIFGYPEEEILGRTLQETVIPVTYHEDYSKGIDRLKGTNRGTAIGRTLEFTAIRKGGIEFPIELSLSTVLLRGEWHALAIIRDISDRKEMEKKLRESHKMSSLGELTASVFHEILNPVNIISSHIQLLLMEAGKDSKAEADLKSIQEEIQRIIKITDGLLRFSRNEELEVQEVDVNNILERTISIIEPEMKLDKIDIVRKFEFALPTITVSGDELRQVFLNLITNARDSMPNGGILTVKTRKVQLAECVTCRQRAQRIEIKGDCLEISFSDSGCGIEKDDLNRIFDTFFTTKKEGRGTGLGLSISYKIIENLKGTIGVDSEVGKGTTFVINLPVAFSSFNNKNDIK